MYIDSRHQITDLSLIHEAIERRPFATVMASGPPLLAAHVPLVLERRAGQPAVLTGHVAAADPIADFLARGCEVLVSFLGPVSYVTPRWYVGPGLPTYDFVAVEVQGTAEPFSDPGEVMSHLMTLTDHHEALVGDQDRWYPDDGQVDYIHSLLEDLQAFHLTMDKVQAKFKLSQERTPWDRAAVIAGLQRASHQDQDAVASLMERLTSIEEAPAEAT